MSQPFIPRKDADFEDWAQAFASHARQDPARYMLAQAVVDRIDQCVSAYSQALRVATTPSTRTIVTVAKKDDARSSAEAFLRLLAGQIKLNEGISDDDKKAIGVRPRRDGWSFVPVASTHPLLNIIAATPGCHTLRFHDSMTPTSRAKPYGATCLQLFVAITDGQSEQDLSSPTPKSATFLGSYTKNPIAVAYDSEDAGKLATYFGRWANRRGDTGPWSLPASFTIAFAGASATTTSTSRRKAEKNNEATHLPIGLAA